MARPGSEFKIGGINDNLNAISHRFHLTIIANAFVLLISQLHFYRSKNYVYRSKTSNSPVYAFILISKIRVGTKEYEISH